jgi:hypothetical protein
MDKLQCLKNWYKGNEERLTEQLNKLVGISETRKGECGDKPGTVRLNVIVRRLRLSITVEEK